MSYLALQKPMLFGHRGLNTVATENTLPAIERAAAAGACGVEVDVRTCASGELVVLHDATLERVTGGADYRAVASLPLEELRRVSLLGNARIPELSEVLARCAELGLCLNIEMKRDVPRRLDVVTGTARSVRRQADSPAVIVSSFDPFMLAAFRTTARSVPAALLLEPEHLYLQHVAAPLGAVAVHLDRRLVTSKLLARFRSHDLLVVAWTVNEPREARHLLAAGVDGIITDDPATLRPLVEQFRARR